MTWYGLFLFLHVVGALVLFAALAIELVAAGGVRAAERVEHLQLWTQTMQRVARLFPIATVLLLVAGLALVPLSRSFAWEEPFVVLGIGLLVVLAGMGQAVQGKHWERLAQAASALPDGPIPPEITAQVSESSPWISLMMSTGIAVAVVALMTAKPGWFVSLVIVVGAAVLGVLLGRTIPQRRPTTRA